MLDFEEGEVVPKTTNYCAAPGRSDLTYLLLAVPLVVKELTAWAAKNAIRLR